MATYSELRDGERWVWSVERLWELSAELPVFDWNIDEFDFDLDIWFCGVNVPTVRAVLEHQRRIANSDLSKPIILSAAGAIMDGVHRVCKAERASKRTVRAVQFTDDPTPDRREPAR